MRDANRSGANTVVIVGENELANQEATVRAMDTGEQRSVPLDQLSDALG